MTAPPLFRPILPAVAAALLLGLPAWAEYSPAISHPTLQEQPGIETVEATPVPEPRSLLFVGLGGLVLLFVALRRK